MRIAILGTRGIPNNYGGFEQCAEHLALDLVKRGHEVFVYTSHNHFYQQKEYEGVKLLHIQDPEYKMGNLGRFVYNYNCIKDLKLRGCDVVLQMGHTSSSIFNWILPNQFKLVTNMEGFEWKRKKHGFPAKTFIRFAEKLAVKRSNFLISDSIVIKDYIQSTYHKDSSFIPYGTGIFTAPDLSVLKKYKLTPNNYNMFIGKLEPDYHIETILDGAVGSDTGTDFLIISKHLTKYGSFLKEKYKANKNIKFIGGIFDEEILNNLRYFSNLYFHGHSIGGTSPLLIKAMASNALICAHNNAFNRHILGEDGIYFETSADVSNYIRQIKKTDLLYSKVLERNMNKVSDKYTWNHVTDQYESIFKSAVSIN